jgi:glucosamine--fructose-6-phosphate aminotransferase (isomerizing)
VIGYVGPREAAPLLLDGLERLEYRGYDSAGICLQSNDRLQLTRSVGNVSRLRARLTNGGGEGRAGVGHTRWATHGRVLECNAHPLLSPKGEVAIVLNGIIENHATLREEFIARDACFCSDTDAEVLAHLVEGCYTGDLVAAVRSAHARLEGHFAYVVVHRDHPGLLVGGRLQCPLVVGVGTGERFLASSVTALLPETARIQLLHDDELVAVTADSSRFFSPDRDLPNRDVIEVKLPTAATTKLSHEDFMFKEIEEQPRAVARTLDANTGPRQLRPGQVDKYLTRAQRIIFVACGTSYHAGLVGTHMFEGWARLASECHVASEWRYRDPVLAADTLVVGISQSGETADTIAALRRARAAGARTLAITNSPDSQITREVDAALITDAGPQIGVAATKTFTAQVAVLALAGLRAGRLRATLEPARLAELEAELYALPQQIARYLTGDHPVKQIAQRYHNRSFFLYLGRQAGLAVALEGALKLKEISYIPAEAYPAGEMKHGPIALLDEGTPVVIVATGSHVYGKLLSNIQEVRARAAAVIAIASDGNEAIQHLVDDVIFVPHTNPYLQPVLAVLPLQQLAYHVARLHNVNIDQPRNLAKTVTVE